MPATEAVPAHYVRPAEHSAVAPLSSCSIFLLLALASFLVCVCGVAMVLVYEAVTGTVVVILGVLDGAVVASAWAGARSVRGATYGHTEGQVLTYLRGVLSERGIAFTVGVPRRWPLGTYRNIKVPSLGLRIGILNGPKDRSLVLFKGVESANEESAQLLLMALDKGLFRWGDLPSPSGWL